MRATQVPGLLKVGSPFGFPTGIDKGFCWVSFLLHQSVEQYSYVKLTSSSRCPVQCVGFGVKTASSSAVENLN